MMHWRARRRLPGLLDETLSAQEAIDVELHLADCARCRSVLRELDWSEELLLAIPASILPVDSGAPSGAGYGRLRSLARWSLEPAPAPAGMWRIHALGAASLAVLCLIGVALGGGTYSPGFDADATGIVWTSASSDVRLLPPNLR